MRKTKNVTIIEDGQELRFLVKQMPATALSRWTTQAMLLLSRLGVDASRNDPVGAAQVLRERGDGKLLCGLAGLSVDDLEPLQNDLLACCYHISGPNSMTRLTPDIVDSIVSDMCTLFKLENEALELNLGFMLPEGGLSGLFANPSGCQTTQPTSDKAP